MSRSDTTQMAPYSRATVVPCHGGDMRNPTYWGILKQLGFTKQDME